MRVLAHVPASTYDDDLLQANPNHVGEGWDEDEDEDGDEEEDQEHEAQNEDNNDGINVNIISKPTPRKDPLGNDRTDEQECDDVETLVAGFDKTRI
jgi:hypothetical protein